MRERVIISAIERGDYTKVLQLSIDEESAMITTHQESCTIGNDMLFRRTKN